ncbi:MAG: alpha-mannosidase [Athalassotoga sp.]
MYFSSGKWKDLDYRRLKRQVSELFPLSVISRKVIDNWTIEVNGKVRKIKIGDVWDYKEFPVIFRSNAVFERANSSQIISLEIWTGGESLVRVDGVSYGEINEHHRFLDVTKFCDGKSHSIEIESVPKGLFGTTNYTPSLEKAFMTTFDEEILNGFLAFDMVSNLIESVDDELKDKIYRIFMESLGMIDIPSSTQDYESRSLDDEMMADLMKEWEAPNFKINMGVKLNQKIRSQITNATKHLTSSLKMEGLPFTIYAMGHSHIDYAWLWPLKETKRKIVRTFANALRMMDKFPDFKFTQSSSAYYEDFKMREPELFEKIRSYVKEGRWEPIGGSVIEFDANLTSGESIARQFLYGQKFFEKEFGKRCKIGYLPDTFGFTWSLPQIMKESGIDYFVTTKLVWSDKNIFPYSWFAWRGLDGTEIVTHLFTATEGYNSPLIPKDLKLGWDFHKEKHSDVPFSILTFGYGDGGGGPTDEMMIRYNFMRNLPGLPKLEIKNFEAVFESYKFKDLPVVDDELYLEFHRGTYTNQSIIKRLNRQMENLLYTAEVLASADYKNGGEYPHKVLTDARMALARAQFHDVLPGSSIGEVYKEFGGMLEEQRKAVNTLVDEIISKHKKDDREKISIVNVTNLKLPVLLRNENVPVGFYTDCVVQKGEDGIYVVGKEIDGLKTLTLSKSKSVKGSIKADDKSLENGLIKVEVKDDRVNVFDKRAKRYLFKEGLSLVARRDIPAEFEGWDVPYDSEKEVRLTPKKAYLYENGPVMASLKFEYEFQGSKIEMIARIYDDYDNVDLKFDIDWHTRRYNLRLDMPMDLLTREATFEIAYGMIKRKTTKNNSYEEAKFEVPYHRWLNLSEDDFGISVVNDSKYGCAVNGSNVSLSLVRGATMPDFYSDEGHHEFTFSFFPTGKEWKEKTVKHAIVLNTPMPAVQGEVEDFLKVLRIFDDESVILSAIKREEDGDGVVVRFYEPYGKRTSVEFSNSVTLSNILEDKFKRAKKLEVKPFEVKTIIY